MSKIKEPEATIRRLHSHMAGKGMVVGRTVSRRLFDGLARAFHIDVGWSMGEVKLRAYGSKDAELGSFTMTDDSQIGEAIDWINSTVQEFLYNAGVLSREHEEGDDMLIEDVSVMRDER